MYLRRELRRRRRQAILIALGLALGVGLVITVTAAATGVQAAQGTALHSLYEWRRRWSRSASRPGSGGNGPPAAPASGVQVS